MQDQTLTRVLALFLAALVVLGAMAAYALRTVSRSIEGSDWVNQSYALIHEYQQIGALGRQADGLVRTYAFSGDPRDLASARETFAAIAERLENAKALTRRDASTHEALLRIEAQIGEREKQAEAVASAGSPDRIRALLAEDAGSPAVAAIERSLARLRDAQFDLLSERDHVAYDRAQMTRWIVGTGIGLNVLLLAAVGWLLRDDLAARRRAAQVLADANTQLEAKVRERTAELSASNDRLIAENLERKWTMASQEHQLRYNQLIVNSVNDLVFVLTKALTVTRINAAVVHLTGREDQGILTGPLSRVVEVAIDPVTGLDPLARALREGRDLHRQAATVLTRDGHRVAASLTLIPLRDQDKVVGGVAIVQVSLPGSPANSSQA